MKSVKIDKTKMITWLKGQRHKNSIVGRMGYSLYHLGIVFASDENRATAERAYRRYLNSGKNAHGNKS